MHRLATKCTETDNQACTGRVSFCYSLTSWILVSHARLSGLSLGTFTITNCIRWIGSCVPDVCQLVTETGLILPHCQYTVRRWQYTIGYHRKFRNSSAELLYLFPLPLTEMDQRTVEANHNATNSHALNCEVRLVSYNQTRKS